MVFTARGVHRLPVTPGQLMLRRRAAVCLPLADRVEANPDAVPGVALLEADLLDRGWLLSAAVRDTLTRIDVVDLVGVGSQLLADCDALLGADRSHVPLFRDFPASAPGDTLAFFVDRILTVWFQFPDLPCVLCERAGTVAPVNPCGHLVCSACFDGADFSACPICHRRIALDDPFLLPDRQRPRRDSDELPGRLRVLHLGGSLLGDAAEELAGLLARTAALSPADTDALAQLLDMQPRDDLGWVPAHLPGRATKARLLAWLLADPRPPGALDLAASLVDTATDVLRLLVVRSGGDASLIARPRLAAVSRPLRRDLLALLDRIPLAQLVEDFRRHRRAWIGAGERLHPGEYAGRYPTAALAFAVLRGSDLRAHPAGERLPGPLVAGAVKVLEGEALRRAATLPDVQRAVVDTGLDTLIVPFAERTASRSLVTLARGSAVSVPVGRHLRLFCHWMENDGGPRVDLDLSVALYDESWTHVGTCAFTSLTIAGAVHSGDLTSAPAPLGASEFVDLDI